VVAADGTIAGDDVIIYDRFHLPTLRTLGEEQYALKHKVPVESVYAYIEAKHGLVVKGTEGGSVTKAVDQVRKVKGLINQRKSVPLNTINRILHLPTTPKTPEGYPNLRNPAYAIIFARTVKITKNSSPIEDTSKISAAINEIDLDIDHETAPDLIVLGKSCLMHPVEGTEANPKCRSPFMRPTTTRYLTQSPDGLAFGASLLFLMAALEYMEVGRISWDELVFDAFKSDA